MTKADYRAHFDKEEKVWKSLNFDRTRAKSVVYRCLIESLTCTVPELVSRCLDVDLLKGFRCQPNMFQNTLILSHLDRLRTQVRTECVDRLTALGALTRTSDSVVEQGHEVLIKLHGAANRPPKMSLISKSQPLVRALNGSVDWELLRLKLKNRFGALSGFERVEIGTEPNLRAGCYNPVEVSDSYCFNDGNVDGADRHVYALRTPTKASRYLRVDIARAEDSANAYVLQVRLPVFLRLKVDEKVRVVRVAITMCQCLLLLPGDEDYEMVTDTKKHWRLECSRTGVRLPYYRMRALCQYTLDCGDECDTEPNLVSSALLFAMAHVEGAHLSSPIERGRRLCELDRFMDGGGGGGDSLFQDVQSWLDHALGKMSAKRRVEFQRSFATVLRVFVNAHMACLVLPGTVRVDKISPEAITSSPSAVGPRP